jgi:hypothetical protein
MEETGSTDAKSGAGKNGSLIRFQNWKYTLLLCAVFLLYACAETEF